jgi:hypothetical protein
VLVVEQKDLAARLGCHLGDAPAHGARADDAGGLELRCHVLDYCLIAVASRPVQALV